MTSPTGAAIRDFLQVLARRWRGANVLIVPVRVQGDGAAEEIAAAIATVNRLARPIDCLVVTRGGGSMEDLWSFNEEVVVRAIVASRIPVISAVGHEIDVTLSDLAADVRALTPSEAAELVAPASEDLFVAPRGWTNAWRRACGRGLCRPVRGSTPSRGTPPFAVRINACLNFRAGWMNGKCRSRRTVNGLLRLARNRVDTLASRLESLSPLAVFSRGYSLTQRTSDGQIIRAASELTPGEQITTRFAQGSSTSRVERIEP